MKIIFMGTPTFAVPILDMLHANYDVLMVVTQPDKPVGRKKILTASPVKQRAQSLSIPLFQPEKLKDDYRKLIDLDADLIITAAYGQMLPEALLNHYKAINVHGSLLPKYRGGAPIQYALFDGLKETGITIMYMVYKMDAGDIIKQESICIDDDDNYQTLSIRLSHVGAKLLHEVLELYKVNHSIEAIPQQEDAVTFAKTLKPKDEIVSFHQSTDQVINRVRGLTPEPGATAFIKNTPLKFFRVIKSDIINDKAGAGTVLMCKKKLIIKTNDGAIEVLYIQAPGKNVMPAKDFLNGQNIMHEGDIFDEGSL